LDLADLHMVALFFNFGDLILHQAQDLAYDVVEDGFQGVSEILINDPCSFAMHYLRLQGNSLIIDTHGCVVLYTLEVYSELFVIASVGSFDRILEVQHHLLLGLWLQLFPLRLTNNEPDVPLEGLIKIHRAAQVA
jgi:hypothetical protein